MSAHVSVENRPSRRMGKTLERLEAAEGVHENALAAAMNLVNPFPDYTVKRVGWPSSKASSSVVLVDLFETTIKQPAGLAAGDTWDCHVCVLPQAFEGISHNIDDDTGVINAGPTGYIYPLAVYTAVTGSLPDPLSGSTVVDPVANYAYGPLAEGNAFRIVAEALEVQNTSAQLYKGGASYAYRYEAPRGVTSRYTTQGPSGTQVLVVGGGVDVTARPPINVDDIDDWPNVFIGDGADGFYSMNTPQSMDNEVVCQAWRDNLYANRPGDIKSPGTISLSSGGNNGWNMFGGFLTGLAQNSSLLVKHRVYLEIFPTLQGEGGNPHPFLRLTNPTTPDSYVIRELLSNILRDMPAGCPFTENPLGEWFQSILEKIEHLAPLIGGALTTIHPAAGLIASGVGMAARGTRKLISQKKAKPKAQASSSAVPSSAKLSAKALTKQSTSRFTLAKKS